jgi:L-threonylcarbamoyladenylate synthase
LSPETESDERLTEAITILRNGGVVALPSDTLYALVARAQDAPAVERVFAIKGRDNTKALPLFVADAAMAERCGVLNDLARRLVTSFWPGALTVVLQKQPGFDSAALSGGDTVALRVPDHDLLRQVIAELDAPLTATSANRSGGPDPVTAEEVLRQLGTDIDYGLDAGPCAVGVSSTIVDCCGAVPVILRRGAISKEAIDQALATF